MAKDYQIIYMELSSMSDAAYGSNLQPASAALQKGSIALAFPIIYLTRPDDPLVADITDVVKNMMNQMVDDLSAQSFLSKRPVKDGNYALVFLAPKPSSPHSGEAGARVPKIPYPGAGSSGVSLPLPHKSEDLI